MDHLALVDVPVPEPAAGEVLVQPFLRPINPTDVLFLKGAYGASFPLPRVPGSEGELAQGIMVRRFLLVLLL